LEKAVLEMNSDTTILNNQKDALKNKKKQAKWVEGEAEGETLKSKGNNQTHRSRGVTKGNVQKTAERGTGDQRGGGTATG